MSELPKPNRLTLDSAAYDLMQAVAYINICAEAPPPLDELVPPGLSQLDLLNWAVDHPGRFSAKVYTGVFLNGAPVLDIKLIYRAPTRVWQVDIVCTQTPFKIENILQKCTYMRGDFITTAEHTRLVSELAEDMTRLVQHWGISSETRVHSDLLSWDRIDKVGSQGVYKTHDGAVNILTTTFVVLEDGSVQPAEGTPVVYDAQHPSTPGAGTVILPPQTIAVIIVRHPTETRSTPALTWLINTEGLTQLTQGDSL